MKNMKNITNESNEELAKITTIEARIKYIDELNEKSSNDTGQWIYVNDELGIVWQPNQPLVIGGDPVVPEPSTPPVALDDLVKWGKTMDFDTIPKNAVVLIKLNVQDPMRVQMMQRAVATQVLQPRIEKLKQNSVCVLFMQSDDDISVMTEEEMGKAGWEKKDKKLIITPGA